MHGPSITGSICRRDRFKLCTITLHIGLDNLYGKLHHVNVVAIIVICLLPVVFDNFIYQDLVLAQMNSHCSVTCNVVLPQLYIVFLGMIGVHVCTPFSTRVPSCMPSCLLPS